MASAADRNNGEKTVNFPCAATQFKPGNPGRPKGSRNKLGEDFVEALHADFQEHGVDTITKVRIGDPTAYLKVIASVVPKEVIHSPGGLEDIDDEQLNRLFIDAALRAAGIDPARSRARAKALSAPMSDEPPLAPGSRSEPA